MCRHWTDCPPGRLSSARTLPPWPSTARNRVPIIRMIKVKNLFSCSHILYRKVNVSTQLQLASTYVWMVFPRNEAGKILPGLDTPSETRKLRSLPPLPEHFFQITAPLTTATTRRTRPTMMPWWGWRAEEVLWKKGKGPWLQAWILTLLKFSWRLLISW